MCNFWNLILQGSQPWGVTFAKSEAGKEDESPITVVESVNEKEGSLTEISMNHTASVRKDDTLVATGGLKGQLEYVKLNPSKLSSFLEEPPETARLQLERPHTNVILYVTHDHYFILGSSDLDLSKSLLPTISSQDVQQISDVKKSANDLTNERTEERSKMQIIELLIYVCC